MLLLSLSLSLSQRILDTLDSAEDEADFDYVPMDDVADVPLESSEGMEGMEESHHPAATAGGGAETGKAKKKKAVASGAGRVATVSHDSIDEQDIDATSDQIQSLTRKGLKESKKKASKDARRAETKAQGKKANLSGLTDYDFSTDF